MEHSMSGGVGSEARLHSTLSLAYATEPTQLDIKRVENWRQRSLRAAVGDLCGKRAAMPSEPEGVRLGFGEANGSSFFGRVSQGKENELVRLEVPPVTYKPKRWRKRPRRSYALASRSSD